MGWVSGAGLEGRSQTLVNYDILPAPTASENCQLTDSFSFREHYDCYRQLIYIYRERERGVFC